MKIVICAAHLITFHHRRRLEKALNLAQVALCAVLVVELVQSPHLRTRESDGLEVLICRIFELVDCCYF